MGCYQLHDLILDVQPAGLEARADLVRLWSEFSWDPVAVSPDTRAHHIALRLHEQPFAVPEAARRVFTTDSFSGFEQGDDFYLSEGAFNSTTPVPACTPVATVNVPLPSGTAMKARSPARLSASFCVALICTSRAPWSPA